MTSVPTPYPKQNKLAAPVQNLREQILLYLLTLGSIALALGIGLLAWRAGIRDIQFTIFIFAVALISWYGGGGPAVVASICASIAFDYFFEEPAYTLMIQRANLPHYMLFLLFASVVGWFGTLRRRTEGELRKSRDHLGLEVEQRQALNVELEKRSNQLQATNKELEAFAYSVSHDLRAPIRHIAGFTELLQKHADAVLDDKSRHHMSMILDSASRMGNLVDDLLAFSRIGRAETQKTTVDLEQLVKSVVGEIAPDTQNREVNWRIGTFPICYGDPSMLRLVFSNLVSNALKFTRPREHTEIEVGSLNNSSTETIVFVKDNGVGFDMKYQDKLFGVFQRLHSQEAFEGTGIGLATVQRIVHRHSGRVWAEASLDQGATFYVALPKR
jgi:signal transduction histidine kinase